MIVKVVFKFASLLVHVGEVNEEPGTHVPLSRLDLIWGRRLVVLTQEIAVLEKPPTNLQKLYFILQNNPTFKHGMF